jgi:integrase
MMRLIHAAEQSRRPEKARAIFVAAITGMRRAEICALRCARDIDWDTSIATVAWSILELPGQPLSEMPTKNRRERRVALDELTLGMLRTQVEYMRKRAATVGAALVPDAYIFSDAPDGSEPWRPGSITLYFSRLRRQVGLEHLDFHYLRKFMETYGQNMGFSPVQGAMRAGHDPSVAAKHYTGQLEEVDRKLATAVASLLVPSA